MENNLFQFATKELSQDAFLCWAINWMVVSREGCPEYRLGEHVLNLFLGKENAVEHYENVQVKRQYKHIDVLVLYKVRGIRHGLIIEDKTNSSEHDNQLQEYSKVLAKDESLGITVQQIHIAYVKTGIHYDADKRANANIVDLEQLLKVLTEYGRDVHSEILDQYITFLDAEFQKRIQIRKLIDSCDFTALSPTVVEYDYDYKKPILGTYYGQFCFLNTLFPDRKIWQKIDLSLSQKVYYDYTDSIYSGANRDGSPWTQYCFWGQAYRGNLIDSKKKEAHYLFWRVDCHKSRGRNAQEYYIALRHYDEYAHQKEVNETGKKANERKRKVYGVFREICDKLQKEYPEIIEHIGERAAYKESDLIFIPISNLKMIGSGSIEEIGYFLKSITDRVKKTYMMMCKN